MPAVSISIRSTTTLPRKPPFGISAQSTGLGWDHCRHHHHYPQGLASYSKAGTTFTFHFSILTLSNASLGINNRDIKSESGISFAIASQPFIRHFFVTPCRDINFKTIIPEPSLPPSNKAGTEFGRSGGLANLKEFFFRHLLRNC